MRTVKVGLFQKEKGKGKRMKNLLSACLVQKQECESRFQASILWFKKCNAFFFYTELRKKIPT
jgi:hypothetical protein